MKNLFKFKLKEENIESKHSETVKMKDKKKQTLVKLRDTFKSAKSIKGFNCLIFYLCCKSRERVDYRIKMDRALDTLKREMDLKRFIERQRLITNALFLLLSGKQLFFMTKLSRLTINKDSVIASDNISSSDCEASFLQRHIYYERVAQ